MHSNDDDEASFERWCVMMCVNRLKRRLRLGLPISEIGWRTLARFGISTLRADNRRAAPMLELVNEIVDPPIDLNAMYEALTTLLVSYTRRGAQPA